MSHGSQRENQFADRFFDFDDAPACFEASSVNGRLLFAMS